MKKVLITLVCSISLFACANEDTTEVSSTDTNVVAASEPNEESIQEDEVSGNYEEDQPEEREMDLNGQYPWEFYDDANELSEDRQNNIIFVPSDAEPMEDAIIETIDEEGIRYPESARWSVLLMTFYTQTREMQSEEYINKIIDINDVLIEIGSIDTENDPDLDLSSELEEIELLVNEAKKIRESNM